MEGMCCSVLGYVRSFYLRLSVGKLLAVAILQPVRRRNPLFGFDDNHLLEMIRAHSCGK